MLKIVGRRLEARLRWTQDSPNCRGYSCRCPYATRCFQYQLDTDDLEIANKISQIIRGSSGGYKYRKSDRCHARRRNIAQVSINMVNLNTPLYRVAGNRSLLKRQRCRCSHHRNRTTGLAQGFDRLCWILLAIRRLDCSKQVLKITVGLERGSMKLVDLSITEFAIVLGSMLQLQVVLLLYPLRMGFLTKMVCELTLERKICRIWKTTSRGLRKKRSTYTNY